MTGYARARSSWSAWPSQTTPVTAVNLEQWDAAIYALKRMTLDVTADYGTTRAAIQAAIDDAAAAGGGVVQLAPTTYSLDAALTMKTGVVLRGTTPQTTILKIANNTNIDAIRSTDPAYWPQVLDLQIDCNKANNVGATNGRALRTNFDHGRIHNVYVTNCSTRALDVSDPTIYAQGVYLNITSNCNFSAEQYGIYQHYLNTDSWYLYNNLGGDAPAANIGIEGSPSRWIGNHFDSATTNNVLVSPAAGTPPAVMMWHNIFENAQHESIKINGASFDGAEMAWNVVGNQFNAACSGAVNTYDVISIVGFSVGIPFYGGTFSGNTFRSPSARNIAGLTNATRVSFTGNYWGGYHAGAAISAGAGTSSIVDVGNI